MKAYIITEAEREALLKDLQLEKLIKPDQFAMNPFEEAMQRKVAAHLHRCFHIIVCKHIS